MTWLARILVPIPSARRMGLVDNDRWHKFTWKCFPGDPDATRDFLTRLDVGREAFRLYVLSAREPQCPENCRAEWWACREVRSDFLDHNLYRFSLRANPVKKVKVYDADGTRRKNSRKEAILDREGQQAWLCRQGEQYGFAVDKRVPLVISPTTLHRMYTRNTKISHISADFSGLLRVTDRALFQQAFIHGLGSSRAFGFGMLILQPVDIKG